ncbi:hypothetical protein [Thermaurantiacus sp.]
MPLRLALLVLAGLSATAAVAQVALPVAPSDPLKGSPWIEDRLLTRHCLEVARIRGAIVIDPQTLELVMQGGRPVRLKFGEDCPHLGYYERSYFLPDARGLLCAPNHALMGREGGRCRIRAIATMKRRG